MSRHIALIVIDFDHTIFNTTHFIELLKKSVESFGITSEEFDTKRQYIKDSNSNADLETFADALSSPKKKELYNALHQTITACTINCRYPDVLPFLERHHPFFDVVILTQGDEKLQHEKIQCSNIPSWVSVIVMQKEKHTAFAAFSESYNNISYIDDSGIYIDAVMNAYPNVQIFFMQRPNDCPYAQTGSSRLSNIPIIRDLQFTISPRAT